MTAPRERPIIFSAPMVRAILDGHKTQTRRVVRGQGLQDTLTYLACEDSRDDGGDLQVAYMADHPRGAGYYAYCGEYPQEGTEALGAPFGQPGDRLWVREAFRYAGFSDEHVAIQYEAGGYREFEPTEEQLHPDRFMELWAELSDAMDAAGYVAEDDESYYWPHEDRPEPPHVGRARAPIHMPRWASRLTLEVVSVRVERLQDITDNGARAEGITDGGCLRCGAPEPCACAVPMPDARDSFINLWDSLNGKRLGCAWESNPWVWVIEFTRVTP